MPKHLGGLLIHSWVKALGRVLVALPGAARALHMHGT